MTRFAFPLFLLGAIACGPKASSSGATAGDAGESDYDASTGSTASSSGAGSSSGGSQASSGTTTSSSSSSSSGGSSSGATSSGTSADAGDAGAIADGASDSGSSSGSEGGTVACTRPIGTAQSSDIVIDPGTRHQHISGFGVSTAGSTSMTAAAADLLFSSTTGAGLSLHRIQVPYDGSGGETSIAQMSQARGARVWATPWSPPPTYKDNNNDVEGHLSNASGFASFLVSWVNSMKSAGVNIYAVSSQNEPDANVTYASCAYTPAQLASFVGGSMGPAFAGTGVNILSPETENWCDLPGYLSALESDTAAWAAVNIIATHDYGCNAAAQPMIQQAGKEFWQTEIYDVTGASGIASGLEVASRIYSALVTANVNAWHYWYACSSGNGGLLDANCNATKRLWVEGNFSRFARPGFYRIDVSHAPSSASIVAFGNPADGTTVIVAINAGNSDVSASFFVTGACWPSSVTPWVTSASDDLAAQAAIPVSGGRFSATLPAQTVTSFVGRP